ARNEHHVITGQRQTPAEVSSDAAAAEYRNSHRFDCLRFMAPRRTHQISLSVLRRFDTPAPQLACCRQSCAIACSHSRFERGKEPICPTPWLSQFRSRRLGSGLTPRQPASPPVLTTPGLDRESLNH